MDLGDRQTYLDPPIVIDGKDDILWKYVEGFEGRYAVSNYGHVYSYAKRQRNLIVTPLDRYGYKKVTLLKQSKFHYFTVHRLVAKSFVDNPDNKPQTNHIDNDRANNYYKNLEWVTNKENLYYSHEQGRQIWPKTPIVAIHTITGEERYFPSQHQAARELGLNQGNINNVLRETRKEKTYKNWRFEYAG